MTNSIPHELLSAFLDGELTPEETAQIEALLAESPAARGVLEDLRTISDSLDQLPASPAPKGFTDAVVAATVESTSTKEAAPRRPLLRSRVAAIAVAVAAGLLVIVAVRPGRAPVPAPDSPPGDQLATAQPTLVETPETPETADRQKSLAVPNETVAETISTTGFGRRLVFSDNLDSAEVGQVVLAMASTGDQAVVVKLTVVDIEQGLESLRVLLQAHQIHSADSGSSAGLVVGKDGDKQAAKSAVASADKPEADAGAGRDAPLPGQLVSVFVKASPEQMAKAVATFRREVIRELQIEGPVQIALLGQTPGGRRALARLSRFGKSGPLSPARSRASVGPRPRPDDGGTADNAPGEGRKLAKAKNRTTFDNAAISAQVRIDLPANLLREARRLKTILKRRDGDRQLQVIFVLVEPSKPTRPKAAEPDGGAA